MHTQFKQKLMDEREDMRHRMTCLEWSDDRLFTNANGNLPLWEKCRKRIDQIDKLILEAQNVIG